MGKINAGVTLMQDFCRPNTSVFKSYIDYLDREEAQRNYALPTFNLFNEYMGNPEKSTGLFTNDKDSLTYAEKRQIKNVFEEAQKNESVMWQTVISFDNSWPEKNGLYDAQRQMLDERKLKEVTRPAVNRLLKSEGPEHAVWSAGIHYNTDNIHVHIATVEPYPMREKMIYEGKEEVRGKFKLSNLERCKSSVVNEIMKTREINMMINQVIRKDIVASAELRRFRSDPEIREKFLELYGRTSDIPKNMMRYNNGIMGKNRELIDSISRIYMEKYCLPQYEELQSVLDKQSALYAEAYGGGNWEDFKYSKEADLFTRMGNAVLKSVKEYSQQKKEKEKEMRQDEIENELMEIPEKFSDENQLENNINDTYKNFFEDLKKERESVEKKEKEPVPIDDLQEREKMPEAVAYLQELSEEGEHANAQYALGKLFVTDEKLFDLDKGVEYLEKAASQGNGYAQYRLGGIYLNSQVEAYCPEKGIRYMQELAEDGNEYAQVRMGFEYLKGESIERNIFLAHDYFTKAASQGNRLAESMAADISSESPTGRKFGSPLGELDKALMALKNSMQDAAVETLKNIRTYEWEMNQEAETLNL